MVHTTDASERRKALQLQAHETARKIKAAKILGERKIIEDLENFRAAVLEEAQTLEDLHIY